MPNYKCECPMVFGGDDAQRDRDIHMDSCEFVKIRKQRDAAILKLCKLEDLEYRYEQLREKHGTAQERIEELEGQLDGALRLHTKESAQNCQAYKDLQAALLQVEELQKRLKVGAQQIDGLLYATKESDRLIDGLKNDLEVSENNEDLLEKRLRDMDCQRLVEFEEVKKLLLRFTDLDCCTGYSLGEKDFPAFWDALDAAREYLGKTEKRFCECPGQTGAVSVNGCCVGCKLPIKFPPQKCTRDTDGDGNCWVHPQGCPK